MYYYTKDHLGSVREMLNSSGTIVARYSYDPYGRVSLVSGSNLATKQYTGDYYHATSGLNLTLFRAYDPTFGRWLSRDPIGENGGINIYSYVGNQPISSIDRIGLYGGTFTVTPDKEAFPNAAPNNVVINYHQGLPNSQCCQHVKLIQTVEFNYGSGTGKPQVDYPMKGWNPFTWWTAPPEQHYPYYPYDNQGATPEQTSISDYPGSVVVPVIQIFETCAVCDDTGQVLGCHRWAVASGVGVSGSTGVSGDYPAQPPTSDFTKATGYH
jgi:RHS repeat-associated protein